MRLPLRFVSAAALLFACSEQPLPGLLKAPDDVGGPRVQFDLLAKPLPEIPFPNDIATRYDPDSPTGRRINVSLIAPSLLEQDVRKEFNLLDGFGTFAPMYVQFDRDIDPIVVRNAALDDDFENDAVYVVNLETGEPARLDLGRGSYPTTIGSTNAYFPNDPRALGSSLIFESYDEDANGNGLLDEGEDTNGDGILGKPNTLDPSKPLFGLTNPADRAANPEDRGNHVYRDLMSHYERATHTLIIRPMVPLKQRTRYAVVLTKRLVDQDGKYVQSPFSTVNHASQTNDLAPLLAHVDAGRIPGLTRSDITFAWSFTTQSVTSDLEQIREGLYGRGPLAHLATVAPDRLQPIQYTPNRNSSAEFHPVYPLVGDADGPKGENPYIMPAHMLNPVFEALGPLIAPEWGEDTKHLAETYKFVDYIVFGSFQTLNMLDDPEKPSMDAVFRVNADGGTAMVWQRPKNWVEVERDMLEASHELAPNSPVLDELRADSRRAVRDRVTFMLYVPKPQPERGIEAPFPVALYGHGYGSASFESLGFAGNLAKYGIATVCVNAYGHGLPLSGLEFAFVRGLVAQYGISPLADAAFDGRARDLNRDNVDDSGGDFWVSNTFHTRDVVRQSVIDWLQLIRVFRAFGTYEMGDLNGDGIPELAGDFNGDGVVDVAGPVYDANGLFRPSSDFFAWGLSLGGIISSIASAIDPAIAAAAPFSGAAGLTDIGTRSQLGRLRPAVFLEVFGPLLVSEPTEGGVHLVSVVADASAETRIRLTDAPIALRPGDRVRLENLNPDGEGRSSDEAIVGDDLRFRLVVPADGPSFYDDSPFDDAPIRVGACESDEVRRTEAERLRLKQHADCMLFSVIRDGEVVFTLDTLPKDVSFQSRNYPKDSPLISIGRGLGLKRGTPEFRRLMNLSQAIADPADPGNYAPHYFLDPLPARKGKPLPIILGESNGDDWVPIAAGYTLGRAAGLIDYVYDAERHAKWGMSPNDVLIKTGATEAVQKLRYYRPVAQHMRDPDAPIDPDDRALVDLVMCEAPEHCDGTSLVDVSNLAQDDDTGEFLDKGNSWLGGRPGVPRLKHPLRDVLTRSFESPDENGTLVTRHAAMVVPYLEPDGHHGFDVSHPSDPFDVDLYMINMIGRFFQTRGAELHFDTCMHRDGYTARRGTEGAVRDPRCNWIPEYPAD